MGDPSGDLDGMSADRNNASTQVSVTSLRPLLSVRRGAAAVAFYRAAFGAEERSRFTDAEGNIVAMLSIGDAALIVADEAPEHDNLSPEALGGTTVRIGLEVTDPDAVFAMAIRAGGREVFPVDDQSWGLRQGRLVDSFGHHWLVGRPL